MSWLDEVKWDERGLVPVIAQETNTGRVLMLAWMDRAALARTAETGEAVYYSRSRARLWRKGEESGNVQDVKGIFIDCDAEGRMRGPQLSGWRHVALHIPVEDRQPV